MNRSTSPSPQRHRGWSLVILTLLALCASALVTSAAAAVSTTLPVGAWSTLTQVGNGIQVTGWALDPDTHNAINVDVWVDGHGTRSLAYLPNVSVPARYQPSFGIHHGFRVHLPEAAGIHRVCVHAMDSAKGFTWLSCRSITVNFNPYGRIDTATQSPGRLTVTGWTIDPDQPLSSRPIYLLVDGVVRTKATADLARPDVATAHPDAGPLHGFSLTVPIAEGRHVICMYASNAGLGANATSACKPVAINFSPVGAITALVQQAGGFRVDGWATDPDTSAPLEVTISADGAPYATFLANAVSVVRTGHGFRATYFLPGSRVAAGAHKICVTATNAGAFGRSTVVACRIGTFNYNPSAGGVSAVQKTPGVRVTGWVSDPDTTSAIPAIITADGHALTTVKAGGPGGTHPGHQFDVTVPLGNGQHRVCAVGVNVYFGSANSAPACTTVTLDFNPYGRFERATRDPGSSAIRVTGWAIDPDTTRPLHVNVTVRGVFEMSATANLARTDVANAHPGSGSAHGFSASLPAGLAEQRVCVTAVNLGGGSGDTPLGCHIVNAVHPVVPTAPQRVSALAGFGGASASWTPPISDGGAPWTGYTVTASPGGASVSVGATRTTATVMGLKPRTTYTFTVVARNVAGASAGGVSSPVTTQAAPPPQTSPAPISTSRYIRNIRGTSTTDLAMMKREGAADAAANPSGHGYLILLDIGGQDEVDHGVVLSAGVRFISYSSLVKDLQTYVDGYASRQRVSAPIKIALGTNNDMDVSTSSGANWAKSVVDPVARYAAKYPGITIAGADDIEPGFRGTYTQSRAWLLGYLAATRAPFVFNGSADGCAWTVTNRGCNNGWTMAGLYFLSAGAAPVRILNLPQVYNNTMARQWRYISLTGVGAGHPKINFGGALTEWTACQQVGGCGSLTGTNAWTQMWTQLRAEPQLKIFSLPYSTDLRIDN